MNLVAIALAMLAWLSTTCMAAPRTGDAGEEASASVTFLPDGFSEIKRTGNSIELQGRVYQWGSGLLPTTLTSNEYAVLQNLHLIVTTQSASKTLKATRLDWVAESPTSATIESSGEALGLAARAIQRVDYDGVIEVSLFLDPTAGNNITNVSLVATIPAGRYTTILGYSDRDIRQQKGRQDVLLLPYSGNFLNAINVGDGDRGIWWFADSMKGWVNPSNTSTQLVRDGDSILLSLRLVESQPGRFERTTQIRFGLLATPVKGAPSDLRNQRVVFGPPSSMEQALRSKWKLWWPTAFAFDAYPYTDYQEGDNQRLSLSDRRSYPGLEKNKSLIRDSRAKYGIEWIPYFSAHVLSDLDPELSRNRDQWMVQPPKIFKDGLNPYSNAFAKPVLSHNAPGYSDYLVNRLKQAVRELDADGIYLDHGPPVDSNTAATGGWVQANGARVPALDIFAERDFVKRLHNQLRINGRSGAIFIHSSNREITPAYTHAYAIIDGEQYRHDVIDGDYLALVSLSEFRARFAPSQSGIPTIWLPGDWYVNRKDPRWPGSQRQRLAFRRTIGLALLHDVMLWPQGAHAVDRQRILRLLDRFGIANATFRGYWSEKAFISTAPKALPVSLYVGQSTVLAIVLNTEKNAQDVELSVNPNSEACQSSNLLESASDALTVSASRKAARINLESGDFALAVYELSAECSSELRE